MVEDFRLRVKSLLEQAYAERIKAQNNLDRVNQFITELESAAKTLNALDEGVPLNPVDNSQHTGRIVHGNKPPQPSSRSAKNPDKRDVAAQVAAMLMDSDKPLLRREIFQKLLANGIEIRGKDPEMVLSTMLWRVGEEFGIENKKGVGYILKGKDYGILG